MEPEEEDKAARLLRQQYVQMLSDLHHKDARPLMNARAMLSLYLDSFAAAISPERLALLRDISAELDKAVEDHKKLQRKHQSPPKKKGD